MKKDIKPPKVEGIALAIVPETNELNKEEWNVYMLNLKDEVIEGVLVSSQGYGKHEDREVKTSMLRHFLDKMQPQSFKKVEPIVKDVFGLSNEYWVSFYLNNKMYDKRYVFLADSIREDYFSNVPLIGKRGVMIK